MYYSLRLHLNSRTNISRINIILSTTRTAADAVFCNQIISFIRSTKPHIDPKMTLLFFDKVNAFCFAFLSSIFFYYEWDFVTYRIIKQRMHLRIGEYLSFLRIHDKYQNLTRWPFYLFNI